MKTLLLICIAATLAFAQGGFTGPGAGKTVITVAELSKLPDDSWVTLKGNIVKALPDEKYQFKDATGEVTLEIDHKVWKGLEIGEKDIVEVSGEFDKALLASYNEVDVKVIKKL